MRDSTRSGGDPEGRRLARRRAALLSEAASVARLLEVLLKRAGFDSDIWELIKNLAQQEATELQRAQGRIESRKRFKHLSGHPMLDYRKLNLLFLDECGKSFAEPKTTGPHYFTLGAVSMAEGAVVTYIEASNELKQRFFGTTELTFHEPYMRFHDGPYYFGGDDAKQADFDAALRLLLETADFVAFGVGIRKDEFGRDFVETGIDPYLPTDAYAVAITMLLERYIDFLATLDDARHLGRVMFESQGPLEDALHQLEFARVLVEGSQWVPESAFRNYLETGLRFAPKTGSSPLEIADIVSRDLYEWLIQGCEGETKYWDLLRKKVYHRGDGQMGKFGIKVFPDSDIRERIEAHRNQCGAEN